MRGPLGNLVTTVTLVRVARPYIASFPGPRREGEKGLGTRLDHTRGSHYIHVQPSSFSKAVSCALGKVGKPRMAPKDEQLMAIQHVCTAYHRIADLQATFEHGVATYPIFLRVIICLREACRVIVGLLLRKRSIHHCNSAGAFDWWNDGKLFFLYSEQRPCKKFSTMLALRFQ